MNFPNCPCRQILCLHERPAVCSLLFTLFALIPFGLGSKTYMQPRGLQPAAVKKEVRSFGHEGHVS